jgi:hypothetical protein
MTDINRRTGRIDACSRLVMAVAELMTGPRLPLLPF